jgi:hypothetical protein
VSLVSGLRSGIRSILRSGLNPADTNVIAGVTRDASSGIYCPASSTEWTTFLAAAGDAAGGPACIWGFQDASLQIVDATGLATLGSVNGSPTFQSPVTGWTRTSLRFTEATAGQRAFNNATAPNPNTTSTFVLMIAEFPAVAPGGTRGVVTKVTAGGGHVDLAATGKLSLVDGATTAAANSILGGARLLAYQTDLTHSASVLYTESEKVTGTFAAPGSGNVIGFAGLFPGTAPGIAILYAVEFSGAAAERSTAQVRNLIQFLGFNPLW